MRVHRPALDDTVVHGWVAAILIEAKKIDQRVFFRLAGVAQLTGFIEEKVIASPFLDLVLADMQLLIDLFRLTLLFFDPRDEPIWSVYDLGIVH